MWLVEWIPRPTGGICTNPLGVRPIGESFKNNYRWNGFVTTPVPFYFNFPKNRDFDDLGKVMMKILDLMCSSGPGWWVDAKRSLEHGLGSPISKVTVILPLLPILLGVELNRGTRALAIVRYEGYIYWVWLIKKLRYFVHMDHNPMNSNPKYTTACWDPLVKTSRIVINRVFETQNGVSTCANQYRCDV